MMRTIGKATGVAALLFATQIVFALESLFGGAGSKGPSIPYPSITLNDAGAALLVLLPVSIALQVLQRLPRDPDRLEPEDAVAQRQFWGSFAGIVATGSAFVALCTFAAGFLQTVGQPTLDLNRMFGVPLGALIALLLASDAVAIAQQEAHALKLHHEYRLREIVSLRVAARQVRGIRSAHPRRRFIWWSCGTGIVALTLATTAAWWLTGDGRATFVFGGTALMLAVFAVCSLPRAATAALRGRPLDLVTQLLPIAVVALALATQLTGFALPLVRDREQPWAYVPVIAYGLLVVTPMLLIPVLLCSPRPKTLPPAPLLDLARSKLEADAERLRQKSLNVPERQTWEVLAWTAIGISPLPIVAFPLAAAAAIHRPRSATQSRPALSRAAWICPAVLTVTEVAMLLFLPLYAVAFGWASTA